MSETPRRRRRVRSSESHGDAAALDIYATMPGLEEASAAVPAVPTVAAEPAVWTPDPVDADADALPAERSLRGLVGGGSSQVSPAAALRARDAARPRPEDLARAEAGLAIIRRNWSPANSDK